jgi:thioredoxin reductase
MYDVMIIGGGFAGLAAAMQLGRARRSVLVVDTDEPRNRYSPAVHGFPGQDGRAPFEVRRDLRAELEPYRTVEFLAARAVDARACDGDAFELSLESPTDTTRERARRLILATGVADELPRIPGLAERWGRTVLHCPYCHGFEVGDRRLGVLATSELSLHHALLLGDWSDDVTLFTNDAFAPDAAQRAALAARGTRVETRKVIELVGGEPPSLEGVRLADGEVVPLDAIFVASRTRLTSRIAERLGCELEDGPQGEIVRTDATKETTVKGVFAAGDAARSPHNALFAAADGAMAGVAAHRSLVMAAAGL